MGSKLGFHIQRRRSGWPQVIADTVPSVIKTLEWRIIDEWLPEEQTDPIKIALANKWTDHNVFLLGRHTLTEQHLHNPKDRAYAFWNRLLHDLTGGDRHKVNQVLDRMRRFDAWEGYNEIGTGADSVNLGQFDALVARRFHQEGLRYAGGGFAMTHPSLIDWHAYCQALLATVETGDGDIPDILHLHEYWYPPATWRTLLTPSGEIDATKMRQATKGYMLHWRELYAQEDTPTEMRLPLIISECGWDQAWPEQLGYRRSMLSDDAYLQWLIWYDQELQKPLDGVDYVIGATLYTYGHESRWASFEIDWENGRGILGDLQEYLRQQNQEPHPTEWPRMTNPEPDPGSESSPVAQGTHYVLLSKTISAAWRNALNAYLDAFQATSGQSIEDAIRLGGGEGDHHITLVGSHDAPYGVPPAWEEELRMRCPRAIINRMPGYNALELRREALRRVQTRDCYGASSGIGYA